jgi:hypothetical protein
MGFQIYRHQRDRQDTWYKKKFMKKLLYGTQLRVLVPNKTSYRQDRHTGHFCENGQTRLIFLKEMNAECGWDFRYTGIRETN